MSVLLYDPTEQKHVLLLKEGPWASKRWSVDSRVCDNPFCGCCYVDFECVLSDAASQPQAVSVAFVLDTEKRSIYRAPGRRTPAISDGLAEAVVNELGEAGWNYLYEFLLGIKQEQIENCDPRHLDADFPPEVLRGDATVVGYSEIFPLAPALSFSLGSERWLALDDYCVNPDCDCRQVVLQFLNRGHERGRVRVIKKRPPAIFYNYRERTYEPAQAPEGHKPSLQALLDELRDQNPAFEGEVRKRHKRLKALFRRALRKYEASADRIQPVWEPESLPPVRPDPRTSWQAKPGRNDPCPCGSGRKYKKCCGR